MFLMEKHGLLSLKINQFNLTMPLINLSLTAKFLGMCVMRFAPTHNSLIYIV